MESAQLTSAPVAVQQTLLSSRRLKPTPRRIVVREVNWLGDMVMSLPALRAIRRAYPDAHLAIVVKKELASFFDGATWINDVIPFSVRGGFAGILDRRRIIAEIRERRFDLAVLFPRSFQSALWMAIARVPERAGFMADGRSALLTRRVIGPRGTPNVHMVHLWLGLIRDTLGIEGNADDYEIEVLEPHRVRMRDWLATRRLKPRSRLVVCAPAAAYGPAKEWPAEHYAALVDLLAERYDADCVLVGAPSERLRCERVAGISREGALIAAGETTVGELVAMLSLSDVFIGNDSGSMHVAGALGIPTVAMFGSTNPLRTGPLGRRTRVIYHQIECSPCLKRTCRFGHLNCLRQITPAEVVDTLLALKKDA